jgi:hypothetical protein
VELKTGPTEPSKPTESLGSINGHCFKPLSFRIITQL